MKTLPEHDLPIQIRLQLGQNYAIAIGNCYIIMPGAIVETDCVH